MINNAYTGIYKCQDDIKHFKIRVRFKQVHSTLPLPPLDQTPAPENSYTDELSDDRYFGWQQKVFSQLEKEFFSDSRNCYNELERSYHEIIKQESGVIENRLFTYINEDDFCQTDKSLPTTEANPFETKLYKNMTNLRNRKNNSVNKMFEKLHLSSGDSQIFTEVLPVIDNQIMHVMVDLRPKNSTEEISYYRTEYILCTLKYDEKTQLLTMFPDFSKGEDDPYTIEIHTDSRNIFHYWIFNASEEVDEELKKQECEIKKKLQLRNHEFNKQNLKECEFFYPRQDELHIFVYGEIHTAFDFEYDNLYIQYIVDLPEFWTADEDDKEKLSGITHSVKTRNTGKAFIGFPFDLHLIFNTRNCDYDLGIPKPPTIYFEVSSKDTWSRFRTEGYAYTHIPVNRPGSHLLELPCILTRPKGPCAQMQRYFVGGCTVLDDITWFGIPSDHKGEVINKFGVSTETTGSIEVKMNILQQSLVTSNGSSVNSNTQCSTRRYNIATLVKSVDQVLSAFHRARENMQKARKSLRVKHNIM